MDERKYVISKGGAWYRQRSVLIHEIVKETPKQFQVKLCDLCSEHSSRIPKNSGALVVNREQAEKIALIFKIASKHHGKVEKANNEALDNTIDLIFESKAENGNG